MTKPKTLEEWRRLLLVSEGTHERAKRVGGVTLKSACLHHVLTIRESPIPCNGCPESTRCRRAYELNNLGTTAGVDCLGDYRKDRSR